MQVVKIPSENTLPEGNLPVIDPTIDNACSSNAGGAVTPSRMKDDYGVVQDDSIAATLKWIPYP